MYALSMDIVQWIHANIPEPPTFEKIRRTMIDRLLAVQKEHRTYRDLAMDPPNEWEDWSTVSFSLGFHFASHWVLTCFSLSSRFASHVILTCFAPGFSPASHFASHLPHTKLLTCFTLNFSVAPHFASHLLRTLLLTCFTLCFSRASHLLRTLLPTCRACGWRCPTSSTSHTSPRRPRRTTRLTGYGCTLCCV